MFGDKIRWDKFDAYIRNKYVGKGYKDICKECKCTRFIHWFGSGIVNGYGPCMFKVHKCNNFID